MVSSLPAVMSFFKLKGDFIICLELEDYRVHIDERKRKQSQGGINSSSKKAKVERKNQPNHFLMTPQVT